MRLHATDRPLIVDAATGKVMPVASSLSPALIVPAATAGAMSVRKALARRTAPSRLSSPVPCCNRLALANGVAVYCRIALTSGGVSPGLACSSTAAAPATAGAAMEVPLSVISVCPGACVAPLTWVRIG